MEEEKKEIVSLLKSSGFKQWVRNPKVLLIEKNAEYSEKLRKRGNDILKSTFHNALVHEQVWEKYSMSIAYAETGSEGLALAYGNRSHILMHMGKYAACINDIVRALNITSNKTLSIKLLLRKAKCLHALGSKEFQSVFQEAESLWKGLPDARLKKSFQNDVDNIKHLLTQSVKPKPTAKNRQSEMLDELAHQYKVNDFSAVKVHYNEKYGRHLIATRDLRPGDVIFVEKPFVHNVNIPKVHVFCSHCFAITWAHVPCDHCVWAMFCSEDCKNEAWSKYHDVECSVYDFAKENGGDRAKQIAIRMLIMALKEYGSVEKLKSELMAFDECTDRKKGFVVDDKIETDGFKTIYNLARDVPDESLKKLTRHTKLVLTALAKTTSYFGPNIDASDPKSYKKNKNAVFLGSFFLRLAKISQLNRRHMWDHAYECPNYSSPGHDCVQENCYYPGDYIAPVSSLLNHSCDPNAGRCYTKNGTVILYAIYPNKKTSQIFECYINPYFLDDLALRQEQLVNTFNFRCDCIACQENWPTNKAENVKVTLEDLRFSNKFDDLMKIYSATEVKTLVDSNYDDRTIAHFREGIEYGLKHLSISSQMITMLMDGLQIIFNHIYCMQFCVPDQCHNI